MNGDGNGSRGQETGEQPQKERDGWMQEQIRLSHGGIGGRSQETEENGKP